MQDKINKANELLNTIGYRLSKSCGQVFLTRVGRVDFNGLHAWVDTRVRNVSFINNQVSLYFTSEVSRITGGSSYLKIEDARKIMKIWGNQLDICEKLNALEIVGNQDEILSCISE